MLVVGESRNFPPFINPNFQVMISDNLTKPKPNKQIKLHLSYNFQLHQSVSYGSWIRATKL